MNLSLTGKRALVCGSSQGIGLACAQEIAALGASCTLVARNQQKLEAALESLPQGDGRRHEIMVADFSNPSSLQTIIDQYTRSETVQILVNNTGGPPPGPITEAGPEDFLKAFRQHLVCNQILIKAVLPGMRREKYGRIINILSTSVKTPLPNLGVSNTTRWAVAGWSKTLAREVAADGITVNNILPGSTMTPRLTSLFSQIASQDHSSPEAVSEQWLKKIPMGRFADPLEIGSVVAFLASPAGSFITGVSLPVDGGETPSI